MRSAVALAAVLVASPGVFADVGDPQIRTDHPWYPGELSCSTFERLFATQADLYKRVTGRDVAGDEDKALAAWLWRNTHYWHGTEGVEDLWGKGWSQGGDLRTRSYWTGLFSHGYGLCGTTHSQWTVEMDALLGHARSRGVGVDGHNSFEVFLKGGPYGDGRWVLLDHDISTVIYSDDGTRLVSIPEIKADLKRLADQGYKPEKQRGWIVAGLHPKDAVGVFTGYHCAEYLAGYAGPAPKVHLRRGEKLRRHLEPGLEDGKTFVFWGINPMMAGVPGPARHLTWVNQPDLMYKATRSSPYKDGQARYANAVYTYTPDFAGGSYREGVISEDELQVTFEFYTPFIIGCTPPNTKEWGIYDSGGRNGLVLKGKATCPVSISVDQGRTWKEAGAFQDGMDLTDLVKGFRQYFIRFGAGARTLSGSGLTMRTVCQVNSSLIPRLKDGGTRIAFESTGRALVSAGPTLPQAQTRLVEGAFGTRALTLELSTPRKETVAAVVAAGHVASSSPPSPEVKYQIEYSLDGGQSWSPLVKDWRIVRQGEEPRDFWSQSLCFGSVELPAGSAATSVRVRFRNDGGKNYLRAELHLEYATGKDDATKVTFDWTDDQGAHRESRTYPSGKPAPWELKTGRNVKTRWVEFEPATP
jgi:hypothetical protein